MSQQGKREKSEMTGHQYKDLIANYIRHNYAQHGLVVHTEAKLGRTIVGKHRRVDVLVYCKAQGKTIALECKFQDSSGSADEKYLFAQENMSRMIIPGFVVYAGKGWSDGALHELRRDQCAAECHPNADLARSSDTLELDYILAASFALWECVLPDVSSVVA